MYKCRICDSVCHWVPYGSDKEQGMILFVCTNVDCGHSFTRSVRQLIFDKKKTVL